MDTTTTPAPAAPAETDTPGELTALIEQARTRLTTWEDAADGSLSDDDERAAGTAVAESLAELLAVVTGPLSHHPVKTGTTAA